MRWWRCSYAARHRSCCCCSLLTYPRGLYCDDVLYSCWQRRRSPKKSASCSQNWRFAAVCRLPLLLLVSRETGRVCDSTLHRSKSRTCHFCGMHARNIVLCCISNQKLFAWVVLCVGICQRSKHEQDKDRRDFQEDRSKLSKVGPCCVFVCYPTDCSNLWNIN